MNAKEARQTALENNLNQFNSQYASIQKAIAKAVNQGKYDIFVYEHIIPDVKNKLESEGFKVGQNQGRYNETTINISW